jgi:molybdenum cofactor guanylyltransferase
MDAKTDATLCILAGGESRRMGQPKADLRVRGRPILAYLLDRFDWPGETMLVTTPSRSSPPGAELFDREVVDPVDGAGPLRGVLTALEHLKTPLAIITTIDMPGIDATHLRWLIEQYDPGETLGLMLRHGAQVEPFPLICRANAIDAVRAGFSAGKRSVISLASHSHVRVIDAPREWNESVWTNLNTPDDVKKFIDGLDAT